jgi:hypothetical protein
LGFKSNDISVKLIFHQNSHNQINSKFLFVILFLLSTDPQSTEKI